MNYINGNFFELLTPFSFCSSLPFRIVVGNTIVGLVDNTDQVYMLIVFLSQAYVFEWPIIALY